MKRKQKIASLVFAAACLVAPVHAGEGHRHAVVPQHGGLATEVGAVGLELVAKADSLTVYLMLDDRPVPSAGASGSATIIAGGGKQTVVLDPAGDNRLLARGDFRVGLGVRVALSVTLPGQPETRAHFRLK